MPEATYQIRNINGTFAKLVYCKFGHEFTEENTIIQKGGKKRCRTCKREYGKQCRKQHQNEYKIKARQYVIHTKERVISHYSTSLNCCQCCGEKNTEFLTIDHINNNGAEERKTLGAGYRFYLWLIRNNYPVGYRVLCMNCNLSLGVFGYCPHQKEMIRLA